MIQIYIEKAEEENHIKDQKVKKVENQEEVKAKI
jgi:hypothetical protein